MPLALTRCRIIEGGSRMPRYTPSRALSSVIVACLLTSSCNRPQPVAPLTEPRPEVVSPEAEDEDSTPTASSDTLLCEPVNFQCGCTWDCALLRELPDGVFVRLDSEGEQQFRRDDCSSGSCFQVCEGEQCNPALVPPAETCTEACPPTRAPFTCRRVTGEAIDATGIPCQRESAVGAIDRSSPNAALRSLYRAVRSHDYEAVAVIMGAPAEVRAELEVEFRRERDEILSCLERATVAETQPVEGEPRQLRIRLEGCPSKEGFTGRVEQQDDGTWTIVRL
jgi:hypothetical protein